MGSGITTVVGWLGRIAFKIVCIAIITPIIIIIIINKSSGFRLRLEGLLLGIATSGAL